MNKVFLSGIVSTQPALIQREGQPSHAAFQLRVDHKKSSGEVVHELYPVNAWLKTAEWAAARLRIGTPITLSGYLTRRMTQNNMLTEVTAQEFIVSGLSPARNGGESNGHDADVHP